MRDIISHHYFDMDADLIYDVCANHIATLGRVVLRTIEDLKSKRANP